MNKSAIEKFAKFARKHLIDRVAQKAAFYGVTAKEIFEVESESSDAFVLHGRVHDRRVKTQREALVREVRAKGFAQVVEEAAYTWFNRFSALRFMEVNDYLPTGVRALSSADPAKAEPDLLTRCLDVDLPLDKAEIHRLMDAHQDEELYKRLLIAQCNALSDPLPFLFEKIEDYTELLFPDGLLAPGSLLRRLIDEVPEEDWREIEIVGWLYQFYIAEKKDQVIGKVVKSEDIPAATQLFTPNWIVKYMVQNSLGAQWLATYPTSPLKGQMEYYIEPAEQTPDVNEQLAKVQRDWLEEKGREQKVVGSGQGTVDSNETLTTNHYSLSPEHLTLIDPASGSGHILVEAYEIFKAIYLERGYRLRDVPQLILEKNLFGLEICPRAAQLTGFALMMKGRADDRRLFERGVKLNVMALVDSAGFDAERLAEGVTLSDYGLKPGDLTELKRLFEHATTFGSLIQVPEGLAEKLPALKRLSGATSPDLFVSEALKRLGPLVRQAEMLAAQYDAVVANPPYMGSGGMNALLKKFAKDHFLAAKSDLYACFIERGFTLAHDAGHNSMVTMQSWMFLSAFEKMRTSLLRSRTIRTMAHLGARAFGSISGEVVQTTAFVLHNLPPRGYRHAFFGLRDGDEDEKRRALATNACRFDKAEQAEFERIPSSPIAYWLPQAAIEAYREGKSLGDLCYGQPGLQTSNNERFIRFWSEVCIDTLGLGYSTSEDARISRRKWFPLLKGGEFRKWHGNQDHVVNWWNDGEEIKDFINRQYPYLKGNIDYVVKDRGYFFRPLISFTRITGGMFSARSADAGFIFDVAGSAVFPEGLWRPLLLGFMCSKLAVMYVRAQNPTMTTQSGDVDRLPVLDQSLMRNEQAIETLVERLLGSAEADWNAYERSWDFQSLPLLSGEWSVDSGQWTVDSGQKGRERKGEGNLSTNPCSLSASYALWVKQNRETIAEMQRLEEENNRLFIDAYGLGGELTPDVPIEQITLTVNPAYRYGKRADSGEWSVESGFGEELEARFRQDTMKELISYAIGCMMGRYALDAPGLVLADSRATQPEHMAAYLEKVGRSAEEVTFLPDADGILPLLEEDYFEDDCTGRIVEFLRATFGEAALGENLAFLAENLVKMKRGESPTGAIRRYLATQFFKDHCQTYKKRPIYWLFSSGRERAFQALVYMHRYTPSLLARLRTDYLHELQGKIEIRARRLREVAETGSPADQRDAEKQLAAIRKQQDELRRYDEKLRHAADQRIAIDLDDGVRVNYQKFDGLVEPIKGMAE